jgi:hypothetical protein
MNSSYRISPSHAARAAISALTLSSIHLFSSSRGTRTHRPIRPTPLGRHYWEMAKLDIDRMPTTQFEDPEVAYPLEV